MSNPELSPKKLQEFRAQLEKDMQSSFQDVRNTAAVMQQSINELDRELREGTISETEYYEVMYSLWLTYSF